MSKSIELRINSQALAFVKHSISIESLFGDMEVEWDKTKKDGVPIIVTETATRTKAQVTQMYIRRLMQKTSLLANFDMFPIVTEDLQIGNWRIDSIILQICSNEVKDHRHLFELAMTNLYGVPTSMYDFAKGDTAEPLERYMKTVYPFNVKMFDYGDKPTVAQLEAKLGALI